jgi:hypothetical protein
VEKLKKESENNSKNLEAGENKYKNFYGEQVKQKNLEKIKEEEET